MTRPKNWRTEAALLRREANVCRKAIEELEDSHPEVVLRLLGVVKRLEERAEIISTPPKVKGVTNG